MTMTAMTAAVLSSVRIAQSGIASAVLTTSRQVGGVLGPVIAGMLISGTSFMWGMHIALLMVAAGFFLGFFLTLVVVPRGNSSWQKK
jgi:MFS transporter, DHA2 family, methylenomycin A resistance protein